MNVFAEWKNENKSTRRKHIVKNVCQQIANERERKKRMKEKKKRMENDEKKPQPTVKNTTQRDQKKKFSFSSNKREEEKKIPRTKLFHKIMYEVSFLFFYFCLSQWHLFYCERQKKYCHKKHCRQALKAWKMITPESTRAHTHLNQHILLYLNSIHDHDAKKIGTRCGES